MLNAAEPVNYGANMAFTLVNVYHLGLNSLIQVLADSLPHTAGQQSSLLFTKPDTNL